MSYLKFDKTVMINLEESLTREVLRTNRLGAYHSSTVVDCNTRKYHGLLVMVLNLIWVYTSMGKIISVRRDISIYVNILVIRYLVRFTVWAVLSYQRKRSFPCLKIES